MSDSVSQAAAAIDAVVVPALRARVEALGETESGAFGFYMTRLARGTLFADYDLAIARALLDEGMPAIVHDIGGGFGNLAWLLAMLGARATCIEHNHRRQLGAVALTDALAAAMPDVGGRLAVLKASFPRDDIVGAGAAAIVTNLVCTTSPEKRAEMIRALRAYDLAIVDIDRFLVTTGPDERPATAAEFAGHGLAGESWLEVGRSALFWRFRSSGS